MANSYDVIVIGGGAAGLMAAGHASELGNKVLLLEKMKKPGRKLSITGKGRCNITNIADIQQFIENIEPNGNFLRSTFSRFFSDELLNFMDNIGVKTITERGGRVFPESESAVEVTKSLVNWCLSTKVTIETDHKATKILTENNCIIGVEYHKNGQEKSIIKANKVILATGGASYPGTGSTGEGYKFAKELGHTINPIFPLLVPLTVEGGKTRLLNGLELKNIEGALWVDNKKTDSLFGELTFTEFGLSGPIILSISRRVIPAINAKKEVKISIDLKPALDHKKLDLRLTRDLTTKGKLTIKEILKGLLPKQLIDTCILETGLPSENLGHQVTSEERKKLKNWLKNFEFTIAGYRSFSEAIITGGGVSTKEINQKTMESKIISGLFFAGEIIDLDGPTGGYNLQIAFSTGWIAAEF